MKTISNDIFCKVCEQHLEEKVLANETVKELEIFVDNRYSGRDMYNNQGVSHPCGNKIMEEVFLYDGIEDLYIFLVDGSSSIVRVRRGEKMGDFHAT